MSPQQHPQLEYQASLDLAIQRVFDKWADHLSYGDLARGLLVVANNQMLTFLRRLE